MLAFLRHEHVVHFGLRCSTAHHLDIGPLPRMHRDVDVPSPQADVRSMGRRGWSAWHHHHVVAMDEARHVHGVERLASSCGEALSEIHVSFVACAWYHETSVVPPRVARPGGRSGRNPSEGGRDLGQIRTDVSRSIETSWGRYRSEGEPIDTFRRTRGHPRFRPGWVRFQTGSFRVRTGFGSEQTGETRFEGRLRGATVPFPVRFNGGLRPRTTGHFPSGERVHKS